MTEAYLQHVWHRHKIGAEAFVTSDDRKVELISPGILNRDAGPDFLHAKLRIDGLLMAGHVEVHIRSSDWFRHGHQNDKLYNAVILHVVYETDTVAVRSDGSPIPEIALRGHLDEMPFWRYEQWLQEKNWIPCATEAQRWDHDKMRIWLERLAFNKLESRWKEIEKLMIKGKSFRQCAWELTSRSFGMRVNADAFQELARRVDWKKVVFCMEKEDEVLEGLLFGASGLLNQDLHEDYPCQLRELWLRWSERLGIKPMSIENWRFARLRPHNFPTIRLAQLCAFIRRAHPSLPFERTSELLKARPHAYWQNHYRFGKTSNRSIDPEPGNTFLLQFKINAESPLHFAASRRTGRAGDEYLQFLAEFPPEDNRISRGFSALGFRSECALDSQGLLELKSRYCDKNACWTCSIGQDLLTSYFEDKVHSRVEIDRKDEVRH